MSYCFVKGASIIIYLIFTIFTIVVSQSKIFLSRNGSNSKYSYLKALISGGTTVPVQGKVLPVYIRFSFIENKMIWNFLQNFKNVDSLESDFVVMVLNQPITINAELVKIFWNKAVLRILVDGGSNRWRTFLHDKSLKDFKLPSFISGDFDSITEQSRTFFQSKNVKFIATPDQDETDFTKALLCVADFCKSNNLNIKMVFAICENSGRFDQIMANINTIHKSKSILQNIPVIIFSRQCFTWVLPSGSHTIHLPEEFVQRQYPCGLIPFLGSTRVTTSGFKWNLQDQTLDFGGLVSTSNTYSNKEISVSCNNDLAFTTQYDDNDQ